MLPPLHASITYRGRGKGEGGRGKGKRALYNSRTSMSPILKTKTTVGIMPMQSNSTCMVYKFIVELDKTCMNAISIQKSYNRFLSSGMP